ncbi:hypothetical protein QBC43DRAFT_70136 [Cladorrhinum sp. PSN259]|nr:hypothetical protein QBC43DRAFT_70136 [Cladorrhinum sp. PSN259]
MAAIRPGTSPATAILISSDDEFDDLDGQSDTSFESLDELIRKKTGRITGIASKGVDAASNNSEAPKPSVTSMADLDNASPASPPALHSARCVCFSPVTRGDRCIRHPRLSVMYRLAREAKSLECKADHEGSEGDEPELADAGLPLQPVPDDRGEQNGMCPTVSPQVGESSACLPTLQKDESTRELEPADGESRIEPQSPYSTTSGRGVTPQPTSVSYGLSQHRDQRSNTIQTSDPKHRRPLVSDNRGEQDGDGSVVLPQVQGSRADMLSLSGDRSGNEGKMVNAEPSAQPSASQVQANLEHNVSPRRRRRHCDTDDEEDCAPIAGTDVEQGKNEGVDQPAPGKRRRVNNSAQRSPPTQGPRRQVNAGVRSHDLQRAALWKKRARQSKLLPRYFW